MTNFTKNYFYTLLFALVATSSLECCHWLKAGKKIRNLNKANATKCLDTVRLAAENYKRSMPSEVDRSGLNLVRGTVNVGTDNNGAPIILAYLSAGNKTNNIGKMLCSDAYLGRESFAQQAAYWALQGYYVIAFDPLGGGLSSTNDPVAMDGVKGHAGYSYNQTAALYRQALVNLGVGVTTAASPLTLVGTTGDALSLLSYAVLFSNDSRAASYIVAMQPAFNPSVSDSPCAISVFTTADAEALAQFYAFDRCEALCLIYTGDHEYYGVFSDPACPNYAAFLLAKAVEFGATTPPAIFERLLVHTLAIDQTALMAQVSIPVLITNSGVLQELEYRLASSVGFAGLCYGCQPGCNDTNYILPFEDAIIYTFNTNAVPHLTRSSLFNAAVVNFVKQNTVCDPYLGLQISNGYPCATPCIQH